MDILESCLYAEDLEAERQFYEELLGLECFVYKPPRQAFFRLDNTVLLVFNPEETKQADKLPPHGAEGCIHVCFRIEPEFLRQRESLLQEAGYKISRAEWPCGESIYTYDPAGHLVEFAPAAIWQLD